MVRIFVHFILTSALFFSLPSKAAVLQEGWYKVVSGGQHIGFLVQRYEFDEKKSQYSATSYIQTNAMGGGIKESYKTTANKALEPISYQYTSQIGQLTKMIDATFSKGVMTGKLTEGDKVTNIQNKLAKGTFLSQFLVYVIMTNKKGMKVGNKFVYSAIAEEDGKAYDGEAYVDSMQNVNGVETYRVLNTFKNAKYTNYVTPKGILLLTKDPLNSLSTEMVASSEVATKGFEVNGKVLNTLFGTLPKSSLPAALDAGTPSKESKEPAQEPAVEPSKKIAPLEKDVVPKGLSVPPGKGLQTEGQ